MSSYLRKKIRFLASKRSSLELEMVLRRFLDKHLDRLDEKQLSSLEELLSMDDLKLTRAIFKKTMPESDIDPGLWDLILESAYENFI